MPAIARPITIASVRSSSHAATLIAMTQMMGPPMASATRLPRDGRLSGSKWTSTVTILPQGCVRLQLPHRAGPLGILRDSNQGAGSGERVDRAGSSHSLLRVFGCALACAAVCAVSASPAWADPRPFGHPCTAEPYGVRFCPAASLSDRVPSWDGAPLDVDVSLPPTGDGPFPTIVMLHGYAQDKTVFETTDPPGGAAGDFFANHFNNAWFAQRGYAVVNETMRGMGNSCGNEQSRVNTPACDDVTFELGDQRYDGRDVQHLLGLLVDQGIADSRALGVSGISGGSLVASALALLKDRIRLLNGEFAPWLSPDGTPLEIAAAYPEWAISDAIDAVAPN